MKVACVYFDHFAVALEAGESPEILRRPLIIGGFPSERKPVFDCSAKAAKLGILAGMPLRQAHHICPDALFIPLDKNKYICAFDEILDILEQFSPAVEADDLGKAFLDVSGLEGLVGSDKDIARRVQAEISHRAHLNPKIAIASNKFVAELAANLASSQNPSIIGKGDEKAFLSPLPALLLPVSEETKRRFDLLGLRTLEQIASLTLDALASQFGEEGVLSHRLANGNDSRPLIPRIKPIILEQELRSDNSLETVESLLAAMDKLLSKLLTALKNRNQVCGEMRICFHLDGISAWHERLTLKEPTDSKTEIMSFLKHRIEALHLPAAVTGMSLGLAQLSAESAKQSPLLTGERAKQKEQLGRVTKRLQARFGENPLKKVIEVDPASRIPERRCILTDFNP